MVNYIWGGQEIHKFYFTIAPNDKLIIDVVKHEQEG